MDPEIQEETQKRYDALCGRITSLRTSTEEVWKTMETAERSLVAMVATDELDVRSLFRPSGAQRTSDVTLAKLRANHEETEQFYMTVSIRIRRQGGLARVTDTSGDTSLHLLKVSENRFSSAHRAAAGFYSRLFYLRLFTLLFTFTSYLSLQFLVLSLRLCSPPLIMRNTE